MTNLKSENTQNVINYFKGLPKEFHLLKGLLIASHNMNKSGKKNFYKSIDTILIAERMDELNKEALKI